jgi:F-type H+-transporting ATPase subunit a
MIGSPLQAEPLFHLGPVPVTTPVVTTWGLMAVLIAGCALLTRRLKLEPGTGQVVLEQFVLGMQGQIRETLRADPGPYLAFLATIFIFVLGCNWLALIPGLEAPTAHLETDAALAGIVFFVVPFFGVRARGLKGYIAEFAQPTWVMLPINIGSRLTRTFSLMMRLFGNMMSGVFVMGILLSLVGVLVPVPFMLLDLLTGLIQAYIFAALAMVFIGGAVASPSPAQGRQT